MKKSMMIILALVMFTSFGYSQLGFKSIRAKIGMVSPEDPYNMGFDIGAAADMGEITKNLHLVPSITYMSSGYTIDFGAWGGEQDFSLTNFQIGADVNYFLHKNIYAGGGVSVNFFGGDIGGSTEFGFDILAGGTYAMKNFNIFTEFKYNFISGFNNFELVAGIEFPMGK
jgi:hypothetical protein